MYKRNLFLGFAVSLVLLVCTACTREVGMIVVDLNRSIDATYRLLDGVKRKSIRLDAGDQLEVEFSTKVDEGNLTLQVLNPENQVIWENFYYENPGEYESNFSLDVQEAGWYELDVVGDGARGGYNLNWSVKS